MSKDKFVIAPHMRLHEWVAEEKGYFADEGLEYEFAGQLQSRDGKVHDLGNNVGAFQTFEKGAPVMSAAPVTGPSTSRQSAGTGNFFAAPILSHLPAF